MRRTGFAIETVALGQAQVPVDTVLVAHEGWLYGRPGKFGRTVARVFAVARFPMGDARTEAGSRLVSSGSEQFDRRTSRNRPV